MSTRSMVPRATGEGGIGTTLLRWATAFINAITCTTINALTLAAAAVGFTISGGTTSKTLTVTANTDLDEAVAMSSKAPKASPSFSAGIGIGGVAAGAGGIAFPATQVPVADANTLDDYEEGTWTPTLARTGSNYAYTTQVGTYIKIGKLVTLFGLIQLGAITTQGTGGNKVEGLPFTSATSGYATGIGTILWNNVLATIVAQGLIVLQTNTIMQFVESANTEANLAVDFVANKYLLFMVSYIAAS